MVDEELKCETCLLCENGCDSAPTNKVHNCPDYERKLSSVMTVADSSDHDADANTTNKFHYICITCDHNGDGCIPNMGHDCSEWKRKENPLTEDCVNHPSHYTQGGIECIKCIEASMKPEGFQDYCKGNVIKYLHRWREKGGVQDLKKAEVYLKWLIESAENGRIA